MPTKSARNNSIAKLIGDDGTACGSVSFYSGGRVQVPVYHTSVVFAARVISIRARKILLYREGAAVSDDSKYHLAI